jgi:CIC family chloride channel protein
MSAAEEGPKARPTGERSTTAERPVTGERTTTTERSLLKLFGSSEIVPLDFRILGRTLLHAAVVGAAAGLLGAAFFAGLEYTQRFLLEGLTGYRLLRAQGEAFVGEGTVTPFRPWLLVLFPAIGALLGGLATRYASEARGGGGDQMIHAFHHLGGVIRRRVIWVKGLASILTLGFGGAGGREGPTMLIGGAIGSSMARLLNVTARERRLLMVAGVAAGMAAVFRTPLGAALLAVEVLYRDDFEAEALVPAILSSVVSYSIVISIFGESVLFARAPRYPFVAQHLPLYILLAVTVAIIGALFLATLRWVQAVSDKTPIPEWLRPALGGLILGMFAVPVIMFVGARTDSPGQGFGLLGGGYGAVQMAITGSSWLPSGWWSVELLLLLCFGKMLAASLTIGTGGSAGDFAPSLVLGGLFGGAFGRAAQLLLNDPRIDPGAFALVGMGTLYGGIAHTPVSALILVSELAGSYDLLVPLMLAEAVALVVLRKKSLYNAQVVSKSESPVHGIALPDKLRSILVGEVMIKDRPYVSFKLSTPAHDVLAEVSSSSWQDSFPVLDESGTLRGLITASALRVLMSEEDSTAWAIAADLMQATVAVRPDDDLRNASRLMLTHGLRELPVTDDSGAVVGFIDEDETVKAYLTAAGISPSSEPLRVDRT